MIQATYDYMSLALKLNFVALDILGINKVLNYVHFQTNTYRTVPYRIAPKRIRMKHHKNFGLKSYHYVLI